ncbi:MAG TPA: UvrD-helicase domain-containing protein [Kiritimatiellia bacterium]|nr:UvrD-helicase domain-containing protein [Kiritimatiellia bacterium]
MARTKPAPPADQALRDRFVNEVDRNFSVIAPAGVGKTKAIVDRVVAIATGDPERARAWLPKLVVVTYTNKAADEMHQRARNAIIEQRAGLPILTSFNRAFFGTIHSFCVRLLRTHGHLCGLPTQFEPVEDDEELWRTFVRQLDTLAPALPPEWVAAVTRLMPMDQVFALARAMRPGLPMPDTLQPPPPVNLKGVLDQTPARKQSAATYARAQRAVQAWLAAWEQQAPFAPLPGCTTTAKDFLAAWENAFGPLRAWLGPAALRVAAEIASAYRAYRRARGALTYDDQIELAWELMRHPEAARRLRTDGYRVVLDEAQDTDPLQFNILLELARPADAEGGWLDRGGAPPEPGRFCMVGDPQQSIYGQRADLACYQQVRSQLLLDRAAEEIVFSVTFRCDKAIIDGVNALVQPMFARTDGQVDYHALKPRPGVAPGQVLRWTPSAPDPDLSGVGPMTVELGRQFARWLKAQGLARLGARTWSDVAVLCPRTRWLQDIAVGLREHGLGPQIHSERAVRGDNAAYAWFTALLTVLAEPDNGFELVGVLRELYGQSDEELARWCEGDGTRWTLRAEPEGDGAPAAALRVLASLAREVAALPLRDAAQRAMDATALADRLRALALPDLAVDDELESLRALAAQAESRDLSLRAFAEELRDGMNEALPARPVAADAVQLLTLHKAKGLQWPVVALPILFRPVGEPTNFPVLVRSASGTPPHVALSSNDLRPMREQVEARRRQELQRLLYVGLTRAQRTLVIGDDDAFFPRKKATHSFANLLGMMGDDGSRIYNETFDALPAELEPEPERAATPAAAAPEAEHVPAGPVLTDALERLAEAPRRVLPYQLGEAEARAERAMDTPDTATRSAGAEAARLYGIWWHETIESLDWAASSAAQRRHWERALAACAQPDRGRVESALLLESATAQRLRNPGLIVRREIPILWRRSDRECVEGIIDLAAWDPDTGRWLIADWKTNVATADTETHLRTIYTPQLRAYAEALHAITGQAVEAGVYSTATGLWIPCA